MRNHPPINPDDLTYMSSVMERFHCRLMTGSGFGMIRELRTDEEIRESVSVIRDSFADVADLFGLSRENCPSHPSFQTVEGLLSMRDGGTLLFGLFSGDKQVGFVAIEKADRELCYMERLAVLPDYRHLGHGSALVLYALERIKQLGGKRASLAIIAGSTVLKKWYEGFGFVENETRSVPRLPFDVCFLELHINR